MSIPNSDSNPEEFFKEISIDEMRRSYERLLRSGRGSGETEFMLKKNLDIIRKS